jgi:peptidoglycan/LPS O-acetylase OafA/YrhL
VIAPLTGVRAFAALWVVIVHLRVGIAHSFELPPALDLFCRVGYLGVDLFGLLSGFVIAYNYGDRLAHRDLGVTARYLWLRAVRIVPLHWFALALLIAARVGFDRFDTTIDHRYDPIDLIPQALLVHGFGFSDLAWNMPSWTVSSEWLCYLLFPLLAPFLLRVRSGGAAIALAAATLAATAVALRFLGYPGFNATTDYGVLRIGGEFATGCLLQRAYVAGFARNAPWAVIAPLSVVGAGLALLLESAAAMVFCFAVLVYALAHQRGALATFLSTRPIVFLGEASYAIYILHFVVLRYFAHAFRGSSDITGAPLVERVAIENPVRRRLRRWVAPV